MLFCDGHINRGNTVGMHISLEEKRICVAVVVGHPKTLRVWLRLPVTSHFGCCELQSPVSCRRVYFPEVTHPSSKRADRARFLISVMRTGDFSIMCMAIQTFIN